MERKLGWADSWTIAAAVCIGIIMAQCFTALFTWTVREINDRDKEAIEAMAEQRRANVAILESNTILETSKKLRSQAENIIRQEKIAQRRAEGLSLVKDAKNHLFTCAEGDSYFCWEPADGTGPWGPFPTKKLALEYIAQHPEHK